MLKHILIICLALGYCMLFAQDAAPPNSILKSWTSASIEYRASKKLRISLEEQLRLKNEGNTYDASFTELNIQYSILKQLKLGVGYRYINKYDDQGKIQGGETHHRYQTYLSFDVPIQRLDIGWRAQYQQAAEMNESQKFSDIIKSNKQWLRLKTDFDYNFKKWKLDPKVGFEYFYRINPDEADEFNKYRLFAGTSYDLNDSHEFSLKYIYENGISTDAFIPEHIIKLSYAFIIKSQNK